MAFGKTRSFHKKFKFLVDVDGFDETVANTGAAGFQKCSELSYEIAKVEHFEGGALIPDKSPGRVTYSDVDLERGATRSQEMHDWAKEVADAASNSGLVDPKYKRNVDIIQQDRDGKTLRRWTLFNAWPIKYVAGEWDNDADENTIEMMTLTYDTFKLSNVEGSG